MNGAKLPSNAQVLGFFSYVQKSNPKMDKKQISQVVYDEIIRFYENANIPTKYPTKKIYDFFEEYRGIKKSLNRTRPMYATEIYNSEVFIKKLDDLFDISKSDALETIKDQRIKTFLEGQRQPGRPGNPENIRQLRHFLKATCLVICRNDEYNSQKIDVWETFRTNRCSISCQRK